MKASAVLLCGTTLTVSGAPVQLHDDATSVISMASDIVENLQDGLQEEGTQIASNPRQAAAALYAVVDQLAIAKALVDAAFPAAKAALEAARG